MGQYGEVTCPYCNEEYDVEWDDLEGNDLCDENNIIQRECDKCYKTFGYTIHVEYSANEAFEIPCKNGEGHDWRDLTTLLPDDTKQDLVDKGRIWQACRHCDTIVKTEEEKLKLDKEQSNIKQSIKEMEEDEEEEDELL